MKKRIQILVVEDEPRILNGISNTLLASFGTIADISLSGNGIEALESIDSNVPDIMITDIKMPELDGIGLIKKVRALGHKELIIIVLTAMEDFQCIQQLIQYGLQNYIVKPFGVDEIVEEVKKALDKTKEYNEHRKIKTLVGKHPDLIDKVDKVSENELINKGIDFIDENIGDAVSLSDVAEFLHVSKSYFSTLFKKEMNMTVVEYLTDQRLLLSKKLLIETDLHICEIAEKVGYTTDKYFIKVFSKKNGMTPQTFRKRCYEGNK